MPSSNTELIDELVGRGALKTEALIKAMKAVDRAFYLPDALKADAYRDRPLRCTYEEGFVHQSAPLVVAPLLAPLLPTIANLPWSGMCCGLTMVG